MDVDVTTETVIKRHAEAVASFAADPANATLWYENIRSSRLVTDPPLDVGSRVEFVAHFLGKRLAYTYEFTDYVPGQRLTMRTTQGPFPMETTYQWEQIPTGETRMTLRNRGTPRGFSTLAAPLMVAAMKRANRKDLARLKRILESGPATPTA